VEGGDIDYRRLRLEDVLGEQVLTVHASTNQSSTYRRLAIRASDVPCDARSVEQKRRTNMQADLAS